MARFIVKLIGISRNPSVAGVVGALAGVAGTAYVVHPSPPKSEPVELLEKLIDRQSEIIIIQAETIKRQSLRIRLFTEELDRINVLKIKPLRDPKKAEPSYPALLPAPEPEQKQDMDLKKQPDAVLEHDSIGFRTEGMTWIPRINMLRSDAPAEQANGLVRPEGSFMLMIVLMLLFTMMHKQKSKARRNVLVA